MRHISQSVAIVLSALLFTTSVGFAADQPVGAEEPIDVVLRCKLRADLVSHSCIGPVMVCTYKPDDPYGYDQGETKICGVCFPPW